jgi:hypothetical protein
MVYERFKGGVVIIRIKGLSFLVRGNSKGENFQVMIASLKVVMTEVVRRYPNTAQAWGFKGETHADLLNLKADGHGFLVLKAGTPEPAAKDIIKYMIKELEARGSASILNSVRDRTWILLHEDGPYHFYLLVQYMLKAAHTDEAEWDRQGTRELMATLEIPVSGADMTHDEARAAAYDDILAIFDIRIGSDQICTSEEIVSNRKEVDALIERLTKNGVVLPGYYTPRYWA